MKWNLGQLQAALKKGAAELPPLVLIYGEDGGTVREYARHVSCMVTPDLDDPFMTSKVSVEDIAQEPSCIRDNAGTVSFGAGLRLVRVEGVNGDLTAATLTKVADALKTALSDPQDGSVIVVAAPGVLNTHAMAKAVEKDKKAVAVRCFHDNARDISSVIQEFMGKYNLRVRPDAMSFLRDNLGNDRDITYRELETLSIYAQGEGEVTLEHCLETISSAPSVSVFKLCDAVGMRDAVQVEKCLKLLKEEGEDLNMILSLVLRHLRRLLQAKEYMNEGMNADAAMAKLTPPVFFGKREFGAQLNKYPLGRLRRLSERFYTLQKQSRTTGLPSDLILERGILSQSM